MNAYQDGYQVRNINEMKTYISVSKPSQTQSWDTHQFKHAIYSNLFSGKTSLNSKNIFYKISEKNLVINLQIPILSFQNLIVFSPKSSKFSS